MFFFPPTDKLIFVVLLFHSSASVTFVFFFCLLKSALCDVIKGADSKCDTDGRLVRATCKWLNFSADDCKQRVTIYRCLKNQPSPVSCRSLFDRVIHLSLSVKKIKFFFKRYLEYEKKHGTPESIQAVKEKAIEFVEAKGTDAAK